MTKKATTNVTNETQPKKTTPATKTLPDRYLDVINEYETLEGDNMSGSVRSDGMHVATTSNTDEVDDSIESVYKYEPKYLYAACYRNSNPGIAPQSLKLDVTAATQLAQAWHNTLNGVRWGSHYDGNGYFSTSCQQYILQVADLLTPQCANRRFYVQQAKLVLEYVLYYSHVHNLAPVDDVITCALYFDILEHFRQVVVTSPIAEFITRQKRGDFDDISDIDYLNAWNKAKELSVYFQGKTEQTIVALLVKFSTLDDVCPWENEMGKPVSAPMEFLQKIMDDVLQSVFGLPDCVKSK